MACEYVLRVSPISELVAAWCLQSVTPFVTNPRVSTVCLRFFNAHRQRCKPIHS
jgi:hypothetical protein